MSAMIKTYMNELKGLGLSVALTLLLMLFSGIALNATHIVGGNMYYTCLGNDMYEITLIIRRDCINGADDAPHDSPQVYLTIFDGNGQFFPRRGENGYVILDLLEVDTLNADLDDFCIEGGDTVCVSQAIYRGMACLPFEKDGYLIAYQRCCRNGTLSNIEQPLETGGTWMVDINAQAQTECNSNPVFNSWPPIYICQNDPLTYDHSAVDPDGDSLVYKLCTPLQGATIANPAPGKSASPPFDSIVWAAPYDRTDMMGGTPLRIDPQTGIITATPDMQGQYLVGVVVEEYRNGVLIGRNKRDFEFNVRACGEKPEADFEVLTTKCDGLTQIFENKSMGATKYTWYFDHPNLTPTSMDENPTHTYDSVGTYRVVLVAENDAGCVDSAIQIIEVLNPMLIAAFDVDVDCMDSIKLTIINNSTGKDSIVQFDWEVVGPTGMVQTSMERNPMFVFRDGGTYVIRLTITDENGCTAYTEQTLEIENVDLDFIQDSFEICQGDEIRILNNGNPNWTYTWNPTTGLKLDPPHDPKACPDTTTTYCVTVTDGNCVATGCVYVAVIDTIPVEIMGDDSTCNGMVMLMAMSDSTDLFEWSTTPDFNPVIATGDKLNYNISTTTTFYVRAGGDSIPCPGITSHKVIFFDAVEDDIPPRQVICFGSGMVELNPDGGNPDYIYSWSPGEFLDDSTSANPKAMLDTTTKFTVVIINPEFPECPDTQMVVVEVGIDFEIGGLVSDTIICDEDSLTLIVTTTPPGLNVVWCDDDGNEIGTGDTLVVDPSTTEFVVVKVSDIPDCVKRDTVRIDFHDFDITIQAPDTICAGDTAMIMLINNGGDSLTIEWFPKEEIIGTNVGPVIKVSPSQTTTYTAVISDNRGCMIERDITINVGGFTTPVIASADPTEVNPGEVIQLNVNIGGNVTYMWTGEELSDSTIQNPTATLFESGDYTYIIKVTDEDGCMGTDSVTVSVRSPNCIDGVFLPNAFSPNGDGQNDLLYVRSLYVQDMHLMIFSRWGEKVFETTSQSVPWDGTYNGNPLPPDVFGYILKYTCIDGEDYVKKGNVSIIK